MAAKIPTMAEMMEGMPLDVQDTMATIWNLGFKSGVEATLDTVSTLLQNDVRRRTRLSLMPVNRQEMEQERQERERHESEIRQHFEGVEQNPEMPFTTPIEDLVLTIRTYTALKRGEVNLVGDLIGKPVSELLKIRNFTLTALQEVKGKLEEFGYELLDDQKPRDTSNDINFES